MLGSRIFSIHQGKEAAMRIVLALMLATASGCLQAQSDSEWQTLSNPKYGWSVSYPAGWKSDAVNPDDVRLHAPDGSAQCGIHGAAVRFETAGEYAEFMMGFNERYFGARGVRLKTSGAHPLALANDVAAIDVLTDMSNGGRSRRIYVVSRPIGFVVDCETHARNWEKLESVFARLIASLTIPKKP
jgi:hypothetical protein